MQLEPPSTPAQIWDPDGLGIDVYADGPRSAWKRNGRELAMATHPLGS
jgi:catechol-2,3-dioxygenase